MQSGAGFRRGPLDVVQGVEPGQRRQIAVRRHQRVEITTGLTAWSMTAGLTDLVLSVVMVMLALLVFRGSQAARVATLTLVTMSILCGLGWSSFAVRGGSTTLRPDGMDERTGRGIADALGLSTSGMSTYAVGGLTCLQVLGYILVIGLLLWPPSNAYFRRSGTTWLGQRSGTMWLGWRNRKTGHPARRWTTVDGRSWTAEYGRRRRRVTFSWRKRPNESDPSEQ